MEIKKGTVEWNGSKDDCLYVDMENGTRYYVMQSLTNGNYIVTTSLLELVDKMTKAENIGLLGADGNMIIPSNNNSIKVLGDNLLLVVPNEAVSDNVKEANSLRLDPLAATRLVSTPAQIKERINAKMSAEGRYELYDQFKEGTLCDANGNNLLNGEYYSFVAKDGDKILLAKNNIDTDVKEFSITDNKFVEETNEVKSVEEAPVEEIITEPVQNIEEVSTEVNTEPVEEVETDLGEETSIDAIDNNFTFDEITSETPTEVVDNGEETEINEVDDYMHEAETDRALKSMSEKNEDIAKETSDLDQFMTTFEAKEDIPEFEFTKPAVKIDNIEKEEEDADILVDATRILNSVSDMMSERDEKIKSLETEKEEIRKEYEEENANLRKELEELKKDSKNRETRDAQEIEYLKGENQEQENTIKKQNAQIDSLKDVVDLYKRKEEETRRSMKTLARSVKNLEALAIGNEIDNEENHSYRKAA